MKRSPLKALKALGASEPAPLFHGDAVALQALSNGTANEGQQKHALKWILERACALPEWAYRPEPRETDIALGRHFVGQQIVGALRVNVSRLKQSEEREEPHG